MVVFWAFGVWGALTGSILLLARSRHAVTAFAVSLLGLLVTSAYQWLIAPPPGLRSAGEIGFTMALWAVAIGVLVFARAVQILLGHSNIENTVRYLGVDVDDALTLSEPDRKRSWVISV